MATDIQVEVHAESTSDALRKLASRMADRTDVNHAVAVQLSSWIARNFAAEGALNQAWAQLSPKYAKWKEKNYGIGKKILERDGQLRASFGNFQYDNDSATVGTSLNYAPYHELGAPEHNLPQRPMLPTPEIALKEAMDVYTTWMQRAGFDVGLT